MVRRKLERSSTLLAALIATLVVSTAASGDPLVIPVTPKAIQITPPNPQTQEPISTRRIGDAEVKVDNTGKGAVLCTWSMLVAAANAARECGWEDKPALAEAIGRIDAFIIVNSPEPITQEQLDARKAADADQGYETAAGRASICEHTAGSHSFGEMLWSIHSTSPDQLAALTSDLLSIPREPVMNPCL